MERFTRWSVFGLAALAFAACDPLDPHDPTVLSPDGALEASQSAANTVSPTAAAFQIMIEDVNARLSEAGTNHRLGIIEYLTHADSEEAGATVVARDLGNKQVDHDFAPFDPRRANWSGPIDGTADDVTYAIDQTGDAVPPFGGLTADQSDAAIVSAMDTWEAVSCSDLPLVRNPDFDFDIGVVAWQLSAGAVGSPFVFADVQHAGWRDLNFGTGVLGATATFIFTDEDGNPTDINGDGKIDVAFREIYYDPSYSWAVDGSNVDVETVALHEAGHGLSQAHFGNVMLLRNGELKAAPRAVMNALYSGPYPTLTGTDTAGHCSIWESWPSR